MEEQQKENLAGTFLEIAREYHAQPATRMFCPCCCQDQNFIFLGDFGLDECYRCPNENCSCIKFVRVR